MLDEYRQSTTDCDCCRCPACGRGDCTGEDCYWPDEAEHSPADEYLIYPEDRTTYGDSFAY